LLQKNNDIFETSVKNTFRGTYCNHRLNFAVGQRYLIKGLITFEGLQNRSKSKDSKDLELSLVSNKKLEWNTTI